MCYNNNIIKREVRLINKATSILYRGLTEEEVMERLGGHNVKYMWEFGRSNVSTITYNKYIVKFIDNICTEVLDR